MHSGNLYKLKMLHSTAQFDFFHLAISSILQCLRNFKGFYDLCLPEWLQK